MKYEDRHVKYPFMRAAESYESFTNQRTGGPPIVIRRNPGRSNHKESQE